MKTKKQELQNIKKVWSKIEYVLNNRTWNKYAEEYLKLNREESRSHQGFKPAGVYHGLTITEEAKFFAVQRLASYLYDLEDAPTVESYLHTVKSVYMAYALATEYEKILKEVITKEEAQHLASLDYCKFAQEEF